MAATPEPSEAPWSHVISKNDHGALVSIVTCLTLTGMLLFLVIRLAIRWPWKQLLGWDDAMTILGSLFAVGHSIAIFRAVHYGLGRHAEDLAQTTLMSMEKAIFAGDILFALALTASKLAVGLLLFRLSSARSTILVAYVLVGLIAAWGVASTLAVSVRPNNATPWQLDKKNAIGAMNIWTGVGTTSVLTEVGLAAFPVFLLWTLQMPIASKLMVIAAFAFRLPVAIVAVLRIVAFRTTLDSVSDIPWRYVVLTIYTEMEMHYSLIAATIPCMHVFLKNFNTGYLATTGHQVDISATMAATKGSNSYQLSKMSRHTQGLGDGVGGRSWQSKGPYGDDELKLRPEGGTVISEIMHRARSGDNTTDAGSVTSEGSDKIIIRCCMEFLNADEEGAIAKPIFKNINAHFRNSLTNYYRTALHHTRQGGFGSYCTLTPNQDIIPQTPVALLSHRHRMASHRPPMVSEQIDSLDKQFSMAVMTPSPKSTALPTRCALLELPPELRNHIWELVVVKDRTIRILPDGWSKETLETGQQPALTRGSRQIREEALPTYYAHNTFRLQPWNRSGADTSLRLLRPYTNKLQHLEIHLCDHDNYFRLDLDIPNRSYSFSRVFNEEVVKDGDTHEDCLVSQSFFYGGECFINILNKQRISYGLSAEELTGVVRKLF